MKGTHKLVAGIAVVTCAAAATLAPRLLSGQAGASELSTTSSATSTASSTKNHVDNPFELHSQLDHKTAADTGVHSSGLTLKARSFDATHTANTSLRGDTQTLPASVDLRAYAMPVQNQGKVHSCVTWAIDYAMLGWYANRDGAKVNRFAPMYTYSQINGGVDKGSDPADALKIAQAQGSDTAADYSQGDYDWQTKPTAAETANASHYRITGWQNVFNSQTESGHGQTGVALLKAYLAQNRPVSIGMPMRAGLNNLRGATVDTDTTSAITGMHEILAVGYNSQGLLIQNSWGTGWGDGGFGRIGWNVVANDVTDAWVINGITFSNANTTNQHQHQHQHGDQADAERRSRCRPGQGLHRVERRARVRPLDAGVEQRGALRALHEHERWKVGRHDLPSLVDQRDVSGAQLGARLHVPVCSRRLRCRRPPQ